MHKVFGVKNKKGFTLVEVMIAVGLFSVIMTIGIGAIIGVNSTQRKTQTMRAVVDNLSFLMEDMARSIRLGDYFYCDTSIAAPNELQIANGGVQLTQNGENCKSIVFEPYWNSLAGDSSNQVMYYIGEDVNENGAIFKKEYNMSWNDDLLVVTPTELKIDINKSGFTVIGAGRTDLIQPRVTIVLVGTVRVGGVETEFNLQTTVSQRYLDSDL